MRPYDSGAGALYREGRARFSLTGTRAQVHLRNKRVYQTDEDNIFHEHSLHCANLAPLGTPIM